MDSGRRLSLLHRLLARVRGEQTPTKPHPASKPRPFQAVAVYRGPAACAMARRFGEHRFLAKDAPSLPLSSCNMPHKCTCRFLKFNDRRETTQRRLMDVGFDVQMFSGKERRFQRGRRSSDR